MNVLEYAVFWNLTEYVNPDDKWKRQPSVYLVLYLDICNNVFIPAQFVNSDKHFIQTLSTFVESYCVEHFVNRVSLNGQSFTRAAL